MSKQSPLIQLAKKSWAMSCLRSRFTFSSFHIRYILPHFHTRWLDSLISFEHCAGGHYSSNPKSCPRQTKCFKLGPTKFWLLEVEEGGGTRNLTLCCQSLSSPYFLGSRLNKSSVCCLRQEKGILNHYYYFKELRNKLLYLLV